MKTKCYVCKKDKKCGNLKGVDICPKCWKWFMCVLPFCPKLTKKICKTKRGIEDWIDRVRNV